MSYASGVRYIEEIKMFDLLQDEMPGWTLLSVRYITVITVSKSASDLKRQRCRRESWRRLTVDFWEGRLSGGCMATDAEKILRNKMRLRLQAFPVVQNRLRGIDAYCLSNCRAR